MVMGPPGIVTGGKGGRFRDVTKGNPGVVSYKTVALDGTGDYTTIQSAINALPSTGGAIYIKNGTYTINSTITISKANVSIIGSGNNTILKAKNSLNSDMIYITANYVELKNFQIDGNSANNASGSGVNANLGGYFTADGLEITSCADYGLRIYRVTDPYDSAVVSAYHNVNNCRIHDCKVPLWLKRVEWSMFTNLTCYNSTQEAAYIHSPSLSKFINCVFSGARAAEYAAVKFDSAGGPASSDVHVLGCTVADANEGGLLILQGKYFMISGNTFRFVCAGANNTYNSIAGNYLDDSTIIGNIFQEGSSATSKNAFEEIAGSGSDANIFYLNRIKNSTSNVTLIGANSISGLNVTA